MSVVAPRPHLLAAVLSASLLSASLLAACPAAAQGRLPLELGLGAGRSDEAASDGSSHESAANAQVALALRDPRSPFGVRAEVLLGRTPTRAAGPGLCDLGALDVCGRYERHRATLGAVFSGTVEFGRRRLTPYAIGGVGTYYRLRSSRLVSRTCRPTEADCVPGASGPETTTAERSFGLSGGMGLRVRLGKLAASAEIRRHVLYDSHERMVPLGLTVWF